MEFIGSYKLSSENQAYLDTALSAVESPLYTGETPPKVMAPEGARTAGTVVVRKTSLDKQIKFYEYCKELYDLEPEMELDADTIGEHAAEYFSRVGFTSPSQWGPFVMYALLRLLNDRGESDRRESYKKSFAKKISRSLFL